ncbi:B3 domain-containing protein Os01g0234100-like [Rutidosis leptorrhynchoides]|uniref:B3 domain-containing protein Os01g0234100-like n=1 Tax=Rutidosis leptorrhynchoides TaxID=125765 RepID=UPI003A9963EA
MAISSWSKPTDTAPLSGEDVKIKALEIKKRFLQSQKKTSTKPKQRVNIDLSNNKIVSYDPKSAAALAKPADSKAKSAAIERANEVLESLQSELPSFVKPMLPSHVTGGFWLGFPKKFCDANLPKHDETVVLVDEDDQEYNTKYLVEKTGLSGGWRGFSIAHKLVEGDVLVFHLVERWKFKVYIVRVHGLNEIDGALGLLNLVPFSMNAGNNVQSAEDMEIDTHHDQDLVVYDQSEGNTDNEEEDSDVSEGLRFSQSDIEFKNVKGIDDFSIVVDGLIIDSEIPKHFKIKYYDLCVSQKMYLHDDLLKGLNVKLAVGIILETITIADAIRACKVTVTREDIETWDKTLKAFEEVGMKVGFLRARIRKLVGLLFESKELLKSKKNERVKAEEEMREINKKLSEVIKNLNDEIKTIKSKGQNLEPVFYKEANAPW